jgi:hypothetical protein
MPAAIEIVALQDESRPHKQLYPKSWSPSLHLASKPREHFDNFLKIKQLNFDQHLTVLLLMRINID